MKRFFRSLIAKLLENQVKRLQSKSSFKTIAVVGSIGKTSTKLAVAHALSKLGKVQFQNGNYNDRVTVPLVFFGQTNPNNVLNVWQWLVILVSNEKQIRNPKRFDYMVLELGTDGPGQIKEFSYIDVDLAIVTAITPEHMEYFDSLDDVANEELSVQAFSKNILINADLCDSKYMKKLDITYRTYGTDRAHDIHISTQKASFTLQFANNVAYTSTEVPMRAKQYSAAAALGVLSFANQSEPKAIKTIIDTILEQQTSGRLQVLPGVNNSKIIDDTYNASPEAVSMAISILQEEPAPQKIAILGSMNELGETSEQSHKDIGALCSPKDIDLLVTIGNEANEYLAPAAKANGCEVHTFTNPFEAGMFVKGRIKNKAVILAKGSQNGVFAEESLKPLLKNRHDEKKLVRQSPSWLAKKRQQFTLSF